MPSRDDDQGDRVRRASSVLRELYPDDGAGLASRADLVRRLNFYPRWLILEGATKIPFGDFPAVARFPDVCDPAISSGGERPANCSFTLTRVERKFTVSRKQLEACEKLSDDETYWSGWALYWQI